MNPKIVLLILIVLPTAAATTITTNERFVAASYASDGASVPAGGTQYFAPFGLHSPRNTETDSLSVAAFNYTVTNMTLISNVLGCGGLTGAQTFSFRFRVNQADTILGANCTSATAAGSVQIDTDRVTIKTGDALSFRVTQSGAVLGVALRVGVGMYGFRNESFTFEPGTGPPGPEGPAVTLIDLPGFTDQEVGGILVFLTFLVLAYFNRWLFVAIACVLGILDLMFKDAGGPAPLIGFTGTLAILLVGLILEVLRDIRDGKDAKGTDGSGQDLAD